MRMLIRAGTIVTVDPQYNVVRGGGIIVEDGTITHILSPKELPPAGSFAGEVMDASSLVAIPGFVQTHIHLCQTLFRGLADDLELLDWLRLKIFPLEAAHNAESMRASALLGLAELIRSGTTTIMDMGSVNHEEEIIAAVEQSGIRAFVGKAMMDINQHYSKLKEPTKQSLATSLKLAERYHGYADGRIRYAFAPRFILSCSDELLRETFAMTSSLDGSLFHTHAAENRDEMDAVRARCKMDNIDYFDELRILSEKTCFAHCIWLNDREVGVMKERGAKVLHCPSSNLKLGSGIADITRYIARGISVSLGADGAPCNNNLDMFMEMRLAALLQKYKHGARTMNARTILELATRGGAEALGIENEVGSIEPGKKADIVFLDIHTVWNSPIGIESDDNIYSTIVYSCDPRNVRSVMVDGKWIVLDGVVRSINEEQVTHEAHGELKQLLGRAEF